jgi:type IV pilus assembly protein PilW
MNTNQRYVRSRQAGLSIIELMVSLLIGLILMAGAIQIFISSKATYSAHEESLRVQENLRFANYFMGRDLRSAGYLGCMSLSEKTEINSILETDPANFDPGLGIQGWEASGTKSSESFELTTDAPSTGTTGWATSASGGVGLPAIRPMPGSDVVQIWRGENSLIGGGIKANESAAQPQVDISGAHSIEANDLILLTDCQSFLLGRACKVNGEVGPGKTSSVIINASCDNKPPGHVKPLIHALNEPIEAMKLVSYIYYVGKRGDAASSRPSLFRRSLKGGVEELIEGVESMQLLYGVDDDADREVDRYLGAEAVADWKSVVSVRLALLLASADGVRTDEGPEGFDLLGVTIKPPEDRRLRRVMTTTIALRNRIL